MFRDLAKFAREHTLSMQFVPGETDKDTGKGKGGGGGGGKGGHDGPSELANYGGQGRGVGGGGGGSGDNCHRCGKPGHRAANCKAPSPISNGKGSKDKAKDSGGKGGKGATGDPSKGHSKGKGKGVNKPKTGYAGAARKTIDDSASESTSESSKVPYCKFKLKGMGRLAAKKSEEEEVDDDDDNVSGYADLLIEVHKKVYMMKKDLGKVKFKNGEPRHSKSEIKAIVDKYHDHLLYSELYDDESS